MGEISVASNEQAAGVAEVGEAVTQMDQVTQQNAALVEQMAAAAASLRSQAGELVKVVDVFKVSGSEAVAPMARPSVRKPNSSEHFKGPEKRAIAAKPQRPAAASASKPAPRAAIAAPPKATAKSDDGDWETF